MQGEPKRDRGRKIGPTIEGPTSEDLLPIDNELRVMFTAKPTLCQVGLLPATVEPKRQLFQHLRLQERRSPGTEGFFVESLHTKAQEAVTYKSVAEETQQKVDMHSKMIDAIRAALRWMRDGDISVSPYDTAWVALVKRVDGGGDGPQFPSCIDWIARNQLPDGSWGDDAFFLVQDRIINTLACIVALKSWNVHRDKCKKGLLFIHENMWRLHEEDENWMLAGFETIFPTLLEMARDLGREMPCDEPALQEIYAKRDIKLAKIPRDVLHSVPTALLLSLEGIPGLDWNRLFKLQSPDGSFMSSAAPTAYALMQTGDKKCLEFLDTIVNKFNGGVPFVYPVELYERLWVVDRLERLGISSYFRSEIDGCLDYAYRHWSEQGVGFTRDCAVRDIDDTAMGFRLLRLHGYHVSPSVFERFEKDGEFVVYAGQSNQSVSAMHNLYRAADQAAFPGDGDGVLGRAMRYSRAFLQERRASGQLNDKWIISTGLPGEVAYALDFPWNSSLPRVETRMYLEQYGGSANVWIGKVLHRMHLFNNDMFLELARADFRSFQRLCRLEWDGLERWCEINNLEMYGVTPKSALRAYFLAAANIFEADRAAERLGWARTAVLAQAFSSFFLSNHNCTHETRQGGAKGLTENGLGHVLHELIDHLAFDSASRNILREAWKQCFMAWSKNESLEACGGNTALLIVHTVEIGSGRHGIAGRNLNHPEYFQLESIASSICNKLSNRNGENMKHTEDLELQVDREMQELAQCVLQGNSAVNRMTRQTFLNVAKSYYYSAHCSPEIIDNHISKVILEDDM